MIIKTVIVDDDINVRESLTRLIKKCFADEVEILASVGSVKEAVKAINIYKPNLIFLDIEMPDESGLSIREYYNQNQFEIIVITAYPKYAVSAIKSEVLDFLIKPVKQNDLIEAIERYKKRLASLSEFKIATFIDNLENDLEINKKILFPSKNTYHIEKIHNIIYCKAEVNYCYIHTTNKNPYLITTTLKHLEDLLPEKLFFRTHKSYLVNLNHIRSFDKKEMELVLENNQVVKVAHRRADELLRRLYG